MQSYTSSTRSALRLRETYGNSDVNSDEKYFSPELRQFKRNARESVESLRNYVITQNWDFDLELIKVNRVENLRFTMATSFSSDILKTNFSAQEHLIGNDYSNKLFKNVEKKKFRKFRVTCIFVYIFDYNSKESDVKLVFKIYNLNNGKYFYIDTSCIIYSSLINYSEIFNCDALICFPSDGSYEIDQEIGKVPLNFVSRRRSERKAFNTDWLTVPVSVTSLVFRLNVGPFSRMLIFGLGVVVEVIVSKISHFDFIDRAIQNVYNKLEKFLRPALRKGLKVIKFFKPSEENVELFDNYYQYSTMLILIKKCIQRETCPYVETRKIMKERFAEACKDNIKNFISILNSIAEARESSTTEILPEKIRNCNDEDTDFSLATFERNIKRQPRQFNNPGWRLHFSDEPMNGIVESFMSQHGGLRKVYEDGFVVELYKGDEKVCVVLSIRWGKEMVINMKYWNIA